MESSDDAVLESFRIGPTTNFGRIWALQVLFCRFSRQKLAYVIHIAWLYAFQGFSALKWVFTVLKSKLNVRNVVIALAAALYVRYFCLKRWTTLSAPNLKYKKKFWKNLMEAALTYEEWAHAATLLEGCEGQKQDCDLYDEDLVASKIDELRHKRFGGIEEIAFHLRTDLVRNLGNMCNPELHKGRLQTPKLIKEYIEEVRMQLRLIVESKAEEFPLEEKLAFIHETRHAFGRTALLLSGGAALGAFHLGVVRTLIEHKLLPRVVTGASVGSIICSFCATRTWTELQSFFQDPMPSMAFFEQIGSVVTSVIRLFNTGALNDVALLQSKLRLLIGDLTFQEAYEISGRVLGVTVSSTSIHEQPRLLNYLTSPHVMIWSAVTASCAFPGLYQAQELMVKDRNGKFIPFQQPLPNHDLDFVEPSMVTKRRWRDGSLDCDLPIKELKELFNVNHYIVSQANPHIAPLLRLKDFCRFWGGNVGVKLANLAEMEMKHRCNQALELGFRFGGIPKLFSQPWEGDVTIVMPATVSQFSKIITNPSPSDLRKAVMQGRRCSWTKVSAIQANCGIELTLDECVIELNSQRVQKLREMQEAARVPGPHSAENCSETNTEEICMKNDDSVSASGVSGEEGDEIGPLVSDSVPKPKFPLLEEKAPDPRVNFGTKRIPSWNCLARESEWGSIDEDGTLRSSVKSRKGSVSESDTGSQLGNSGEHCFEATIQSWVHAGGPLVRRDSPETDFFAYGGSVDNLQNLSGEIMDETEGSRRSQSHFNLVHLWEKLSHPTQTAEESSVSSPRKNPGIIWSLTTETSSLGHESNRAEDIGYGLILRECLRRSPNSAADLTGLETDSHGLECSTALPGEDSGGFAGGGDVAFGSPLVQGTAAAQGKSAADLSSGLDLEDSHGAEGSGECRQPFGSVILSAAEPIGPPDSGMAAAEEPTEGGSC